MFDLGWLILGSYELAYEYGFCTCEEEYLEILALVFGC